MSTVISDYAVRQRQLGNHKEFAALVFCVRMKSTRRAQFTPVDFYFPLKHEYAEQTQNWFLLSDEFWFSLECYLAKSQTDLLMIHSHPRYKRTNLIFSDQDTESDKYFSHSLCSNSNQMGFISGVCNHHLAMERGIYRHWVSGKQRPIKIIFTGLGPASDPGYRNNNSFRPLSTLQPIYG